MLVLKCAQANIGACTVELLLRTRASIVAVEPSPQAAFHLTRSLRLAAQLHPDILSRVIVLPIGAGDVPNTSVPLFVQTNNTGNSVLGRAFTADCRCASGLSATSPPTDPARLLPGFGLLRPALTCSVWTCAPYPPQCSPRRVGLHIAAATTPPAGDVQCIRCTA